MKNIGQKIKSIRKSKGLSQEELASKSTVNVRTIQRIEAGKNMPHGKTLQLICEVLEIQPNEIMEFHLKEDHTTMMWLYFSICSSIVLPFGNLIIPLIIWSNNKERVQHMNEIGRNVVYNQIIYSIFNFILLSWAVYLKINEVSTYKPNTWMLILVVFNFINFGFALYAGIMASKGKYIRYPFFRK